MHGNIPDSGGKLSWTDERVAELRRLAARGLSAGYIAAELGGTTRNSVIGKLHREGIVKGPGKPVRKPATAPRAMRNGGAALSAIKAKAKREREVASRTDDTRARQTLVARARAMGELPANEPVTLPFERRETAPVPLLKLAAHHCRWPICDDGDQILGFCGADRRDASIPYCAHHCRIAYRPVNPSPRLPWRNHR